MSLLRRASSLLTLTFAATLLCGQPNWSVRHFNSNNGLPQNSVNDLFMDTLGYLWIATEGGLARFDGQVFKQFELPGGGVPRSERMQEITSSPSGEILINDWLGNVYSVRDHSALRMIAKEMDDFWHMIGGFPSQANYLYATEDRSQLSTRDGWRRDPLWMLPFDQHRWAVPSATELFWYNDSTLVGRADLPKGAGWFMLDGPSVVVLDSTGAAFRSGFQSPDLRRVDVVNWPTANGTPLVPTSFHWHLGDSAAVVVFGKRYFLLSHATTGDGVAFTPLGPSLPHVGDPSVVVWDPRTNVLAIGTYTDGLYILQRSAFSSRTSSSGGGLDNAFYAQIPMGDSSVVAFNAALRPVLFTPSSSSYFLDGRLQPAYSFALPLPNGGTLISMDGEVWELTNDLRRKYWTNERPLADFNSLCIEADTTWVASPQAISVIVNGVESQLPVHLTTHTGVHCITRGPDGRIWYGTADGISILHTGDWYVEPVTGLEGRTVRTIQKVDGLWFIGTYGDGAFVYQDGRVLPFPLDHNGLARQVHAFMKDDEGFLWRSTNHGLFRCAMREVRAWLADTGRTIHQEYFGTASGIKNPEFNGGCVPAAVRLANGLFSFPTMDGLVQFRPSEVVRNGSDHHFLFEAIQADDRSVPLDNSLRFASGTKRIEICFSIGFWGEPANLQMEYRVLGSDQRWYALDPEQRVITLSNLPAGEYALMLRALGYEDKAGMRPATLSFIMTRPWYTTAWAGLLYLLLLALVVTFLARWYARKVVQRNVALEQAIGERTVSLKQANRSLERSVALKERLIAIVAHDIVSPLRYIAEVARQTNSRVAEGSPVDGGALADIHFASEKLHSNARNLLNWVKQQEGELVAHPRNEVMNLLVEDSLDRVRGEAAHKGIGLNNDVQLDDVLMVDKDLLSIALNNLLMNAVSYMEKGSIRITAHIEEDQYHLVVSDSGPGLGPETLARIERVRDHTEREGVRTDGANAKGLGFVIIAGIMELLSGRFKVSTSAKGTTVVLRLPIKPEANT